LGEKKREGTCCHRGKKRGGEEDKDNSGKKKKKEVSLGIVSQDSRNSSGEKNPGKGKRQGPSPFPAHQRGKKRKGVILGQRVAITHVPPIQNKNSQAFRPCDSGKRSPRWQEKKKSPRPIFSREREPAVSGQKKEGKPDISAPKAKGWSKDLWQKKRGRRRNIGGGEKGETTTTEREKETGGFRLLKKKERGVL